MLPHLPGVPHLHETDPKKGYLQSSGNMPAAKQLDLPASRVQFFLRARSESGRLFMFSAVKASEPERELPSGTNYRNQK